MLGIYNGRELLSSSHEHLSSQSMNLPESVWTTTKLISNLYWWEKHNSHTSQCVISIPCMQSSPSPQLSVMSSPWVPPENPGNNKPCTIALVSSCMPCGPVAMCVCFENCCLNTLSLEWYACRSSHWVQSKKPLQKPVFPCLLVISLREREC